MTDALRHLPVGWTRIRLDRIATVNARIGWKALTASEYQPDGYAFLATPNIKNTEINFTDVNFISEFRYNESPELQLRVGDVLLAKDGNTLGIVNVVRHLPRAATVNGSIAVLRSFDMEPRFLRYVIQSSFVQGHIDSVKDGMGVPHLFQRDIKRFLLPAPPMEEQDRIANFLDAETSRIDRLVHSYGRLATLAEERSQRVLDTSIEQFTNRIPLRYIVRFREGPGIMAADFHPSGVPLVRIAGLQGGEVTLNGCNFLDPEKVARQWSHFRLRLGDRLISGSATMGGVSVVKDPDLVGAVPYTGLIILRPAQPGIDMDYVEAFLRSTLFAQQIDLLKTGAAMQHFGPTHLSQIRAPLPSPDEQRLVAATASEALHHASRCKDLANRQVTLLNERRQALITAAVTGQFDVSTTSGRYVREGASA
ncbi:restriction endonuclease subunit S [Streptomyces tendae]|uniref:restriction endonuclease subunit S n=1 Tax=Streptomyces tendae TaxID=1932 RepID=UPI00369EA27C